MKLCKDCRWASRSWEDFLIFFGTWRFAKCLHQSSRRKLFCYLIEKTTASYVTGKPLSPRKSDYYSCPVQRSKYGECGSEGRYWEPRK